MYSFSNRIEPSVNVVIIIIIYLRVDKTIASVGVVWKQLFYGTESPDPPAYGSCAK